jgi:exoribonuclease R
MMLQSREFMFDLDRESKMPLDFKESKRIESKALVEEYMLLANILIAEHLKESCGGKALMRAHIGVD